jgi:hypothetical protein
MVAEKMWGGVVRKLFLQAKAWSVISLFLFLFSQAILPKETEGPVEDSAEIRIVLLAMRIVTYVLTLGGLVVNNIMQTFKGYRNGDVTSVLIIKIPTYLTDAYNACGFLLMLTLVLMVTHEPMIRCMGDSHWPRDDCPGGENSVYSMASMFSVVCMWVAVIRLSVFSTKLSAFVLVCSHVLTEVGRFLIALVFVLLTFGCAITCLKSEVHEEYETVAQCVIALFSVTVGLYEKDYREFHNEQVLMFAVLSFIVVSAIILMNLLIAQLNCSYEVVYADMVGFARMERASLIVETLVTCPAVRWVTFAKSLRLDRFLEFNEGDVGLSGGLQVREPASLNPTVTDSVQRYGGSTSVELPWPEDRDVAVSIDRCERLGALLRTLNKELTKVHEEASSSSDVHGERPRRSRGDNRMNRSSLMNSGDDEDDE